MSFERNNTAMDFEAMLRSHVQGSGVPVDCDGFDPDAASAYLEGGLAPQARATYESHLAFCTPCRQQLIQFARVFSPEEMPALAAPALPWRDRLSQAINTKVGGWLGAFDFRWNGQTAAWAGGALATMLLTAIAFQSFRPAPQPTAEAGNLAALTAAPIPGATFDPPTALTPNGDLASLNKPTGAPTPVASSGSGTIVPRPEVTPILNASGAFAATPLRAAADNLALTTTQPVAAPPAVPQLPTGFNGNNPQSMIVSQVSGQEVIHVGNAEPVRLAEAEIARNEIGSRMSLSPNDNPMRAVSMRTMERRTAAPAVERPAWRDRVMGFMPYKKEERTAVEKLPVEEESLKAMKIRIRDRVFYFSNGAWIDNDYRPEMAWRVTRLVRDSEEYQRVLGEAPGLKAYFAKGAITVIWGDKIYKVVSK